MRESCKYFQRRTYASGDGAQFCALGLAPEAPWRCPDHCPRFTRRPERLAMEFPSEPAAPAAPPSGAAGQPTVEPALHPDAVVLLSSAEEIISAVGPEIQAEQRRQRLEQARRAESWWGKLKGRSPRWPR